MKQKKLGFTLIEMAIVVVLIAIIISGIVVTQDLLRNSQLRAVTSEVAQYTQAINNFRDKYQAMPGDFSTASGIWSGVTDGDGNDLITVNISAVRLDEQFLAWQHLAKAEMIKGNFTGVAGSAGVRDRVAGENIPTSQLSKSGWGLISVTLTDIAGGYTEIPYTAPDIPPNHVLWLGKGTISGIADSQMPPLTAKEALDIDKKSDDGLPRSGKIIAQTNISSGYFTSTCSTSATAYNISSDRLNCSLVFKTGF